MRYIRLIIIALSIAIFSVQAFDGARFDHKDWYLACDNTGTCRAAGYAPAGLGYGMAMMFRREAGPATQITAKLFLQLHDEQALPASVTLLIDNQDLGPIYTDKTSQLSAMQVQALLAVVTTNAVIEVGAGKQRWRISNNGASAVFRKMDEYQGRSNTPFAVVAKGKQSENEVPPAKVPPSLTVQTPQSNAVTLEIGSSAYNEVLQLLTTNVSASELDFELQSASLETAKLGEGKRFIGACWLMAYNALCNHWLADKNSPNQLVALDSDGFYIDGMARQDRKGRGYGDCWENQAWVFDGQSMVPTLISSTGPCRGIAGGIDPMPTYITDVTFSSKH